MPMFNMLRRAGRAAFVAALVMAGAAPAAADLLIANVTLIDGTGAPPLPGASVLVTGERIALVSPGKIRAPRETKTINGRGKFLIPGLIDTHIHLRGGTERGRPINDRAAAMPALHSFLYSGVTSVADHGNNPAFIFPLRDDERTGRIVAPRIFAAGSAVNFPKRAGDNPNAALIGAREEVPAKLDAMLAHGPDLLKLVIEDDSVTLGRVVPVLPELLADIVHYANRRGVRVTAHVGGAEEFAKALDAGMNALAHAPIRNRLDDEALRLAAARRVPISTTAVVFANIARVADDTSWLDAPLFKATLDAATLTAQKVDERERYRSSGMSARFAPMIANILDNIARLHGAGAILALGSDRTFGPMTLQELELYAQAGIPLLDCITIATRNAALYLGREDDLGTITRGKLADLVLLDKDPLADVANFAAVDTVIKGGAVIDLAALDLPVNAARAK